MLGAKPINIDTTETAMAIQKGTVDGAILPYTTFNSMGIHEVCKYATFYGQGVSGYLTVMNLDKWNSLQPELKALMTDVAKTIPVEHSKLWEAEGKRILDTWKAKNVEITDFTAAQRAEITKRLVPAVWDSWIKSTQDKGGQKVLDALQAAIKKYEGTK